MIQLLLMMLILPLGGAQTPTPSNTAAAASTGGLYESLISFQLVLPMPADGVTAFMSDFSHASLLRSSIAAGLNGAAYPSSLGARDIIGADVYITALYNYATGLTQEVTKYSPFNRATRLRRLSDGDSGGWAVHGRALQTVPSSGLLLSFQLALQSPLAPQTAILAQSVTTALAAAGAGSNTLLAQLLSNTAASAALSIAVADVAVPASSIAATAVQLVTSGSSSNGSGSGSSSSSGSSGTSASALGVYIGVPLAVIAAVVGIAVAVVRLQQVKKVRSDAAGAARAVVGAGVGAGINHHMSGRRANTDSARAAASVGDSDGLQLDSDTFSKDGAAATALDSASYVGSQVKAAAEGAAAAGMAAAANAVAAPLLSVSSSGAQALADAAGSSVTTALSAARSGLSDAAHAAADGMASMLEAAVPAVPIIGAAMLALAQVYREVQRVKANSVECKRLAERMARLHSMLKQVGDDEPFVSRHAATFESLLTTLRTASGAVADIADRSTTSAFISARSDAAVLSSLDTDITHHIAELSAAMQAETLTAVRVIHEAVASGKAAQDKAAESAAAAAAAAAVVAGPPPPFSMQFHLKDFAFDPPLETQKLKAPRGTYGMVVSGIWRANMLPVAIKLLPARGPSGDVLISINAWLSEAELMRRLRESKGAGQVPAHIVLLYGIGVVEGPLGADTYLVVMELMKCSLREVLNRYLREGKQPALGRALTWLLETAQGIAECHAVSVVHSDIKAANVLVSERNEAKIGDLGTARVTRGLAATMTNGGGTAAGARGSPLWLAPEMVEDPEAAPGMPSDVYSWAITAWEILSCCLPYHDKEGNMLVNVEKLQCRLDLVAGRLRPDVGAIREDCPVAVVALLQRAWASDPLQRPAIADVVREMQAVVQAQRSALEAAAAAASPTLQLADAVSLPGTSV